MEENTSASIEQAEKILVIGLTGIGNVLLCVPALKELKRKYPKAQITLYTLPINRGLELLVETKCLDKITYARYEKYRTSGRFNWLSNLVGIVRDVWRLRKERYDVSLYVFSGRPKRRFSMFVYLVNAKISLVHSHQHRGYAKSRITRVPVIHGHDVTQNLNLLAALGIHPKEIDSRIELDSASLTWADAYLKQLGIDRSRPLIGMQPGGKAQFDTKRQWPQENFRIVAEQLIDKYGCFVFLFGLANEEDLLRQIEHGRSQRIIRVVEYPLARVASILYNLSCFISNDSALMHLAAAVGTPTIGLFGPTNPVRTAPFGEGHYVLKGGADIDPRYDLLEQKRKKRYDADINKISVDMVMRAAERILNEPQGVPPCSR